MIDNERILGELLDYDGMWSGYKRAELLCPTCGFNYNHIGRVKTMLGWESRETATEVEAEWDGRGDGFAIEMDGECGHTWELRVGFHKGISCVWAQITEQESRYGEDGL